DSWCIAAPGRRTAQRDQSRTSSYKTLPNKIDESANVRLRRVREHAMAEAADPSATVVRIELLQWRDETRDVVFERAAGRDEPRGIEVALHETRPRAVGKRAGQIPLP